MEPFPIRNETPYERYDKLVAAAMDFKGNNEVACQVYANLANAEARVLASGVRTRIEGDVHLT